MTLRKMTRAGNMFEENLNKIKQRKPAVKRKNKKFNYALS